MIRRRVRVLRVLRVLRIRAVKQLVLDPVVRLVLVREPVHSAVDSGHGTVDGVHGSHGGVVEAIRHRVARLRRAATHRVNHLLDGVFRGFRGLRRAVAHDARGTADGRRDGVFRGFLRGGDAVVARRGTGFVI